MWGLRKRTQASCILICVAYWYVYFPNESKTRTKNFCWFLIFSKVRDSPYEYLWLVTGTLLYRSWIVHLEAPLLYCSGKFFESFSVLLSVIGCFHQHAHFRRLVFILHGSELLRIPSPRELLRWMENSSPFREMPLISSYQFNSESVPFRLTLIFLYRPSWTQGSLSCLDWPVLHGNTLHLQWMDFYRLSSTTVWLVSRVTGLFLVLMSVGDSSLVCFCEKKMSRQFLCTHASHGRDWMKKRIELRRFLVSKHDGLRLRNPLTAPPVASEAATENCAQGSFSVNTGSN